MRVFKNAWFSRFARKKHISDRSLLDAVGLIEQGRIDANLGGGLIKQRIPRPGQGKSGGYRTIVVFCNREMRKHSRRRHATSSR